MLRSDLINDDKIVFMKSRLHALPYYSKWVEQEKPNTKQQSHNKDKK
jgi:hypothetical protein